MAIPILQAQQGSLRYVSEFSRLSRNSPYRRPLIHLVRVAGFIEEQVATEACEAALMQLESLSSGGSPQKAPNPNKSNNTNATEKMEAGEAPDEYFELELTDACKVYKNVELLASKTYVRGIILILVYFDGQFYCTMGEGQGDQPLLDVAFPDMSRRGGGCMIGTFSHPYFRKFSVWQGTTPQQQASNSPQGKLKNGSPGARGRQQTRKPRGMASKMADANDDARNRSGGGEEENNTSDDPIDELGTEGQTYIIFKHPSTKESDSGENDGGENDGGDDDAENNSAMNESTRPAFFRFGGFCYGGNVVVRHGPNEMTLSDVSTILPSLGEQQRSMSFSTELERLPTTSRQYRALLRLQRASEYLLEQLMNAENELNQLRSFLEKRGQKAWVDDESRNVYFELQLTSEGSEPLKDIEVAASKIHINGVLLSTMYFGQTLYATVSGGSGEHALLDSSFPDITTKGRGYTIGATPHSYYKKFAVWEGNAEGTLVGTASSPKSTGHGPALSDSSGSPISNGSAGSKSSSEKGTSEGKTKEGDADASEREAAVAKLPAHSFGGKTGEGSGSSSGSSGGGRKPSIGPVKTAGRRLAPLRKEIGPGGGSSFAGSLSKLAPLGESFANRGNFSGLQPLKKIGADAPWDAMGKPKLGAIGGGRSSNKK